jgi:uncharacterized protein YcbX
VLRVSALNIYPIKSCGGISVASARVQSRGLQYDRRYMLVDGHGRFLTQRQLPEMALLETAIESDELKVSRPDGELLRLPLEPSCADIEHVKVWRSELDASSADNRVNEWFSDFLDRPVRLVYMSEHQHRAVSRKRATQSGDEVSFADGAPILLISEGSLTELNTRLNRPVSMRRFRPNIVVDAADAFIEDRWRHIRINATDLEVAWSCSRCTMITVDPNTGIADSQGEPLRTLREFRRDGAGIMFGQNILTRGAGRLRVGDELAVIEER